jgi:hypothetical protein
LPPFSVIAQPKGGISPYFAISSCGIVKSVYMGFGGSEITDQGIHQIKTAMPKKSKNLT